VHWHIGADKGLVGDRECLRDTGLLGSVSHLCYGSIGDSSGDKVCMWPLGLSGR